MGREGPSVQMGSYIGDLVGKWGHILSGERKQLLAAGAGAGLAAAFAALWQLLRWLSNRSNGLMRPKRLSQPYWPEWLPEPLPI